MRELIVEFLEDNFKLVDSSRDPELRVFCPFCDGGSSRDFSFDVNVEKGTARCWRAKCSWRGSFAKFLVDFLQIEYREAYKIIEGEAPQTADELVGLIRRLQRRVDKPYSEAQEGTNLAIRRWPRGLVRVKDSNALKGMCEWLEKERGYKPEKFLRQHSLYIATQQAKYKNRAMFKVESEDNLAFIAYAMDSDTYPKTLNPGGQVLSRMLYNYNDACNKQMIFVCEGVFDAARLKSWGWPAVSIFGVSISAEQIGLLDRSDAKEIVLCLDNGTEKLSIAMAKKIARAIPDKDVSVMVLKGEGEDPDDISEDKFAQYFMSRKKFIRKDINTLEESINLLLDGQK